MSSNTSQKPGSGLGTMPALLEKPQISRAMWDALKTHILKERQKKKQEQEQDAAIERMRKERENKQKQDVMTLEETKEQVSQLELKLEQFREEKHQLFLQLKKVLNEDETRRKARESDVISVNHYQTSSIPMAGHPNMFMQSGPMTSRSPMYKVVQQPPPQNLIPAASLKRSRSPSPPPGNYPQPAYNYKSQAVPVYNQKHNQYPGPQSSHYYAHPAAGPPGHSTAAPTYPTGSQPVYNYAGHGQYPPGGGASAAARSPQTQPHQSPTEQQQQPQKHVVQHGYHIQHVQQAYMGPNHQSIDHAPKQTFPEDKYYAPSNVQIRGMNSIHHSQAMIPIQQQQPKGSITTGYPIRTQPPPPPTLTSPYPPGPTPTQQHNAYNAQQGNARLGGYTNQPPPGRYY